MQLALQVDPGRFFGRSWRKYKIEIKRNPLLCKMATSAVGHFIGDCMGQTAERAFNKNKRFNYARLARMTGFGLFINGPWAHFWYKYLDMFAFPKLMTTTPVVIFKSLVDQLINAPMGTVTFYAWLCITEGRANEMRSTMQDKLMPTLYANWRVWPFVHLVNFRLIHPSYRILFINIVALFWRMFLSMIGNNRQVKPVENQAPAILASEDAKKGKYQDVSRYSESDDQLVNIVTTQAIASECKSAWWRRTLRK